MIALHPVVSCNISYLNISSQSNFIFRPEVGVVVSSLQKATLRFVCFYGYDFILKNSNYDSYKSNVFGVKIIFGLNIKKKEKDNTKEDTQ